MPLRGLVLLVFFGLSIPVCFARPFYGILLWVIVAFLNPQSYTWTAFDAFPWGMAVAIPTMAGMFLFEPKFARLRSSRVALILALWLWFCVTTVVSINTAHFVHHAADTVDRWKLVSKVLLMTICMIPIVDSFRRLRLLVLTIAGSFGFYVLKSIPWLIMTGGVFRLYGPEHSMIADNNDFGLALNMTLPLYLGLAQTETRRWAKGLFALLFVCTIPAVFFTYSRGALVGLVAVLFVMLLQSKRRFALVPVIIIGAVIAVYLAPPAWQERMNPEGNVLDASAQSRLHAWAYARALAADYPITGGGFATFTPQLFDEYAPTTMEVAYGPHSVYFQVLAEHGYVGLALYLALILSCFLGVHRMRKRARRAGDDEIASYAQMFGFSLVGFLTSGVFLGRAYFDYFFAIAACLTILEHVALERRTAAALPDTEPGARAAGAAPPFGTTASV
jgi:probable O-glycosylation ligase (exosortase A-associated)